MANTAVTILYQTARKYTLTNVLFTCGHTNVVKHPSQHHVIHYAALSATSIFLQVVHLVLSYLSKLEDIKQKFLSISEKNIHGK